MLTYAGVPLGVPLPEHFLWIENNIPVSWSRDFQEKVWPGKNLLGIASPGHVRPRPIKLNTLYWPRGASRWAVFYGIVDDVMLGKIRQQVYVGSQLVAKPLYISEDTPDSQGNLTTAYSINPNMFMLPPRPLAQLPGPVVGGGMGSSDPQQNRIWLLTLVDQRYFWGRKTLGTLSIKETTTTWANLFSSLSTALGITVTNDSVDSAYLKPSKNLIQVDQDASLILDAVAYNVGQRIVANLDGTVNSYQSSNSISAVNSFVTAGDFDVKAGGFLALDSSQSVNYLTSLVPSSVTTSFVADPAATTYAYNVTLTSLNNSYFSGITGHSAVKMFRDMCVASDPSSPSNVSELQALAKQIAKDWYQYQLCAPDVVLAGISPWCNEGLSDAIEWTYLPWDVSTRIYRPAWNDQVEELQHAGTLGSCSDIPVRDVSVSSTTVTSGTQSGNLRWYISNGDSFTTGAPIRVKQTNAYVLDTAKNLKAVFSGFDANGVSIYSTVNQTGFDGTQKICTDTGATKTLTIENGVIKTIA